MKRFVLVLGVAAICSGCTEYYKVSDPSTGKMYYTTKVETRQGATVLKDARTGNQVSIQNSEIEKINKEAFESGKAQPAAEPKKADTNAFK